MSKPTCTVHRWRRVLAWCPLTRGFTRPAVVYVRELIEEREVTP